ncbi:MAG TPA: sulfite exporter TauE/SafE family protein [Burkholderiales bacterium]|nr:sulfite exporter TauE/SafE family protein [Burkholderiales bacterium]
MSLAIATAALLAGALMGLTGIGGVLVVPALTEFGGIGVDNAVAASMMGFLIGGTVAAVVHLRRTRIPGADVAVLALAAGLGSAAGTASLGVLPSTAVRLFIAFLALASGLNALLGPRGQPKPYVPTAPALALLGLAVGFGSALSGTGGPVMLIPILLALRVPPREAIAIGVAAGVPIVFTATALNAFAGRLDYVLGLLLALLIACGTLGGSWLGRRFSGRGLTRTVAAVLVLTGLWYGYVTLR